MPKLIIRGIMLALGLLGLWQALVMLLHIPIYMLPSPLQVFTALWQSKLFLLQQFIPTFIETLAGLSLAIMWGISVAVGMVLFRPLRFWLLPVIIISQAIPTFAFAPLLVLWLGYGIISKIAVIIVALFFPVTSTFFEGMKQTPDAWLDLGVLLQASRWRMVRYISFPAALPALGAGLKVATAWAPMAAIIGEWVGSSRGLGFVILNAQARLDLPLMFAALSLLVCFSLLLYWLVDIGLKYLIPWQGVSL
ncbi:MAG: ssuC [Gammaproteobacteria bacterium]|jgi:putative hydroxymethylpyrimidine transport system permease protein|nr:ssuC [Gammaproteobacteria bacterium]